MARPFTTTLLIPTLNEIDGMKVIMPQIERDWVDQILILDGGSKDGTIEYARDNGYEVYVQQKPGNPPGLHGGAALASRRRPAYLQPGRQLDSRRHSARAGQDGRGGLRHGDRFPISGGRQERGRRYPDRLRQLVLHPQRELILPRDNTRTRW